MGCTEVSLNNDVRCHSTPPMSAQNPQTYEEWCENLRGRPDKDVIVFKDLRNGGVRQQAGIAVWREREDAKQKKIRDEEFHRLTKLKQERESEHTLWRYWCLADWSERFGMVCFLFGVFIVGYLSAKVDVISRVIDLIRSVTP